jgi:hypothetical protein
VVCICWLEYIVCSHLTLPSAGPEKTEQTEKYHICSNYRDMKLNMQENYQVHLIRSDNWIAYNFSFRYILCVLLNGGPVNYWSLLSLRRHCLEPSLT